MSAESSKAASIRQRLLNRARAEGEDFQVLLTRYVLKRFLYRLGRSAHRERFVVKGAMLFVLWEGSLHRMTRDLGPLGSGPSGIADVDQAVLDRSSPSSEDRSAEGRHVGSIRLAESRPPEGGGFNRKTG